ncbi:unnamed protein product, partial [Ixodes pacificus]
PKWEKFRWLKSWAGTAAWTAVTTWRSRQQPTTRSAPSTPCEARRTTLPWTGTRPTRGPSTPCAESGSWPRPAWTPSSPSCAEPCSRENGARAFSACGARGCLALQAKSIQDPPLWRLGDEDPFCPKLSRGRTTRRFPKPCAASKEGRSRNWNSDALTPRQKS